MAGCSSFEEPVPLVIVQGFLGGGGAWLWGNFEHYLNLNVECPRRSIFVSVGPVSSLHDRACELYYGIMGGTVDYGLEHSQAHKHARYGRNIAQGQYPEWSAERPLHFLGHSTGAPTIIKLQSLIKQGHFGPDAETKMILSINSISGAFRGTQMVYIMGERPDAAPAVRPLSAGSILGKFVHVLSFVSPVLPQAFDLHGDCRSLTYRDVSFLSLVKQLWKSDWAESRDATPFDVTFQAVDERESDGEGALEPETFYRSHVALMTRRHSKQAETHTPTLSHVFNPMMYIAAHLLGRFDFSTLRPSPSFHAEQEAPGEEYWANDGVVPVFSQWHPLPCCDTRCRHFPLTGQSIEDQMHQVAPLPGMWYVNEEEEEHHMSLVPLWTGANRQQRFWEKLGTWLAAVELNRRYC
ncbi:alpha/beta-hydrolase [Mycena vitilis]|nr:alpha/beta-hydrolase [Mycena vitilis]